MVWQRCQDPGFENERLLSNDVDDNDNDDDHDDDERFRAGDTILSVEDCSKGRRCL